MSNLYRCDICVNGCFLPEDSCWDCSIGVSSDSDCSKNFKEVGVGNEGKEDNI